MVAIVLAGYNALKVPMGVFSSREKAEELLLSLKCLRVTTPAGNVYFNMSKELRDYVRACNLPMYSCGDIMDFYLHIKDIKLDEIQWGYNDD